MAPFTASLLPPAPVPPSSSTAPRSATLLPVLSLAMFQPFYFWPVKRPETWEELMNWNMDKECSTDPGTFRCESGGIQFSWLKTRVWPYECLLLQIVQFTTLPLPPLPTLPPPPSPSSRLQSLSILLLAVFQPIYICPLSWPGNQKKLMKWIVKNLCCTESGIICFLSRDSRFG